MKTFQDLEKAKDKENFITQCITEYKLSDAYHWAYEGHQYAKQKNSAITNYQKLLYTLTGEAVPDNFSANHKCASNFFNRFVTQENQYLLGNGVIFGDEKTKEKLGGVDFDSQLQKIGKSALIEGVSYAFFNVNKIIVFSSLEFVPLYDEENGMLKAGIRFWQIDYNKPMRITLYELDGYTEYSKTTTGDLITIEEKRPYKFIGKTSVADGFEIASGENYPSLPIVPLFANDNKQSELVGLKSQIDAYDLIKSGFANDLDEASMIYWTLENAGGMDDIDLKKFIERLKVVKAVTLDDTVHAQSHTVEIPYQSRESYLTRLENDMYNDFRAINVNALAAGNVTATAIRSAYQSLDDKCDEYEYQIIQFIRNILELAEIDDYPTFKRNRLSNMTEETQMVISAGEYLDTETILRHLPFIQNDEIDGILDKVTEEEANRFTTE